MTVLLSLAARQARLAGLRGVIDANGGGQLRLYAVAQPATPEDAPADLPLASLALAATSGAVGATGALATLTLTPVNGLVAVAGVVTFARLTDGAGAGIMDLPAGLAGSGPGGTDPAVVLSALQLYQGGEVQLLSCVISE